ncbi:cytokine receptor [Anoplophora glabripennis]|nr:cytokine receptor [Anoplophora glabripennis]
MAFSKEYIRSIIVLITFVSTAGQKCMSSLLTDGYTMPQGDITLRYGEALNITCNLCKEAVDKYGLNASSRLYFTRDNKSIPPEMVKIINSTSINLYIAEHPKTKEANYYCYFNATEGSQMICMNVVYVGVAPQNVTDFSCISRNCDNLTCTWTSPENYVKTDYNLTYNVKSRSSRKNKTKPNCDPIPEDIDFWFLYNCPRISTENRKNVCFWNLSTSPQYRSVHDCYYFAIGMSNDFGVNMNYITFDHFKHVLPNPPENLTAVATSPHSIELSWTIPNSMITFSPGLHHRILYQWEYEKHWHLGGIIRGVKNRTLSFELKNLKYAHILYDIRVSMRSSVADQNDESMWSENATRTIRTKSKVPDCPPKTNLGSFQIVINDNSRNVYIYWQQLKAEQYNGQNLSYIAKILNRPSINNVESVKAYAMLENLTFSEYVVNIWSVNEMGYSSEKSTVIIPAKPLDKPSNFIKEHIGDSYELSWQSPKDPESAAMVTNYTIFWCRNERDRPYQCAGDLSWDVVSKDTRRYTRSLPVTGIYQFAISANSWNSSSGMFWAECTIIPNKSKGKIENVWIKDVHSTFIEIGWSLDCSNRINTIQGFAIHYCPIQKPTQTSCKNGTEKNITIKGDVNLQSGKVTGLTPHTSYRLTVSYILNNFTYSLPSQPLLNTTNEAAPATPPLQVEVIDVTNSSISLKWQPPSKINGYLKNYYVYYNEKVKNTTTNEITLMNLMSFTNYTISIEACTVKCSNRSNPQSVMTQMWLPGNMKQPAIKFQNDSYITVSWERPKLAGGEIDYYQVKIRERLDMEDTPHINVTTTNYTLEGCGSGKYKHLYISVRAVNIINGEHKEGPWSDDLESSCAPYNSVKYLLICSFVIFLGIGMLCVFKRLYLYFNEVRKFVPKLPPGFEIENWNSEKQNDIEIEPNPPADAQLLLHKISETRLSGDSSGCSSGHESITSSIESTAHISPTDSGTEQPRSPSLNEENRKNSLRLRNVSAAPRPPINIGYVTADTLPSATLVPKLSTPAGNYCVLGVDPSNPTKPDPPYVPITDLNTKLPFSSDQPPPYVMTGDLVKASNPGYVPHPATEPADRNMGYVVAGLTKDLLASDLLQCDTPKPAINEEKPLYIRAGESIPTLKPQFSWQQPPPQLALPKSGYVSVGDAPPPKSLTETTKGYVPHRQFEGKSLKED